MSLLLAPELEIVDKDVEDNSDVDDHQHVLGSDPVDKLKRTALITLQTSFGKAIQDPHFDFGPIDAIDVNATEDLLTSSLAKPPVAVFGNNGPVADPYSNADEIDLYTAKFTGVPNADTTRLLYDQLYQSSLTRQIVSDYSASDESSSTVPVGGAEHTPHVHDDGDDDDDDIPFLEEVLDSAAFNTRITPNSSSSNNQDDDDDDMPLLEDCPPLEDAPADDHSTSSFAWFHRDLTADNRTHDAAVDDLASKSQKDPKASSSQISDEKQQQEPQKPKSAPLSSDVQKPLYDELIEGNIYDFRYNRLPPGTQVVGNAHFERDKTNPLLTSIVLSPGAYIKAKTNLPAGRYLSAPYMFMMDVYLEKLPLNTITLYSFDWGNPTHDITISRDGALGFAALTGGSQTRIQTGMWNRVLIAVFYGSYSLSLAIHVNGQFALVVRPQQITGFTDDRSALKEEFVLCGTSRSTMLERTIAIRQLALVRKYFSFSEFSKLNVFHGSVTSYQYKRAKKLLPMYQKMSLSSLYNRPPSIWNHQLIPLIFQQTFLSVQSKLVVPPNFLMVWSLVTKQTASTQQALFPTRPEMTVEYDDADKTDTSDVTTVTKLTTTHAEGTLLKLSALLEDAAALSRLHETASNFKNPIQYVRRITQRISALAPGESACVPIYVSYYCASRSKSNPAYTDGAPMFILVEVMTQTTARITLINTIVDAGLKYHPLTAVSEHSGLSYQPCVSVDDVPLVHISSEATWFGFTEMCFPSNSKQQRNHIGYFYDYAMPLLTGISWEETRARVHRHQIEYARKLVAHHKQGGQTTLTNSQQHIIDLSNGDDVKLDRPNHSYALTTQDYCQFADCVFSPIHGNGNIALLLLELSKYVIRRNGFSEVEAYHLHIAFYLRILDMCYNDLSFDSYLTTGHRHTLLGFYRVVANMTASSSQAATHNPLLNSLTARQLYVIHTGMSRFKKELDSVKLVSFASDKQPTLLLADSNSQAKTTQHALFPFTDHLVPDLANSRVSADIANTAQFDFLNFPPRVTSYGDLIVVLHRLKNICHTINNGLHSGTLDSKKAILSQSALNYVYTQIIPIPISLATRDRAALKQCMYYKNTITYAQLCKILELLEQLQKIIFHQMVLQIHVDEKLIQPFDYSGDRYYEFLDKKYPHVREHYSMQLIAGINIVLFDYMLHKQSIDQPSDLVRFFINNKVGIEMGHFATSTRGLLFTSPDAAIARSRVIEYFTQTKYAKSLLLFETSYYGEEPLNILQYLRSLCACDDQAIGYYFFSPDSEEAQFLATEMRTLGPTMIYYRFAVSRPLAWYPFAAQQSQSPSTYSNETTFTTNGSLLYMYRHRPFDFGPHTAPLYHSMSSAEYVINEHLRQEYRDSHGDSTSGFLATPIQSEDDILYVRSLPTFDNTLNQSDSELLLSYLTTPYLRIPLILTFFASDDRVNALRHPQLRELLESCLFEQGPLVDFTKPEPSLQQVPASTPDELGTHYGLLLNELFFNPHIIVDALEKLYHAACESDIGTIHAGGVHIILFIVRLISYVDNYINWLLHYGDNQVALYPYGSLFNMEFTPTLKQQLTTQRDRLSALLLKDAYGRVSTWAAELFSDLHMHLKRRRYAHQDAQESIDQALEILNKDEESTKKKKLINKPGETPVESSSDSDSDSDSDNDDDPKSKIATNPEVDQVRDLHNAFHTDEDRMDLASRTLEYDWRGIGSENYRKVYEDEETGTYKNPNATSKSMQSANRRKKTTIQTLGDEDASDVSFKPKSGLNTSEVITSSFQFSCTVYAHLLLMLRRYSYSTVPLDASTARDVASVSIFLSTHYDWSESCGVQNHDLYEILFLLRRPLVRVASDLKQLELNQFMEHIVKVTTCTAPLHTDYLVAYLTSQKLFPTSQAEFNQLPEAVQELLRSIPSALSFLNNTPQPLTLEPLSSSSSSSAAMIGPSSSSLIVAPLETQHSSAKVDDDEQPVTIRQWGYIPGHFSQGRYTTTTDTITLPQSVLDQRFGDAEPVDIYSKDLDCEVDFQKFTVSIRNAAMEATPPTIANSSNYLSVFSTPMQSSLLESTKERMHYRVIGTSYDIYLYHPRILEGSRPSCDFIRLYSADSLTKKEQWIAPLFEPLRLTYFANPIDPVLIYIPQDDETEDAQVYRLVVCGELDGLPRYEVRILKAHGVIHLYSYYFYFDRFYPRLVYSTHVDYSYAHLTPDHPSRDEVWEPWARFQTKFQGYGYRIINPAITRSHVEPENLSGTMETIIPPEILTGTIPEWLLLQYTYWQDERGNIRGYPRHKNLAKYVPKPNDDYIIFIELATVSNVDVIAKAGTMARVTKVPTHIMQRRHKEMVRYHMLAAEEDERAALLLLAKSAMAEESNSNPVKSASSPQSPKSPVEIDSPVQDDHMLNTSAIASDGLVSTSMCYELVDILYSPKFTALHQVASVLGRIDSLANVLVWKKCTDVSSLTAPQYTLGSSAYLMSTSSCEHEYGAGPLPSSAGVKAADGYSSKTGETYGSIKYANLEDDSPELTEQQEAQAIQEMNSTFIDSIELPQLGLTFIPRVDECGDLQLYSADHSNLFVSNIRSRELDELTDGIPHHIMLQNINNELFLLVPCHRVVRPVLDTNPESCELLIFKQPSTWLGSLESTYFLYPIHQSHTFVFTPTLASSLYLLLLRFLRRKYEETMKLIDGIATDAPFTPGEKLIFMELSQVITDKSPEATACILRITSATQDATTDIPWRYPLFLLRYSAFGFSHFVSPLLRLPPEDELTLLRQTLDVASINVALRVSAQPNPEWSFPVLAMYNRFQYLEALVFHLPSRTALTPRFVHDISPGTTILPCIDELITYYYQQKENIDTAAIPSYTIQRSALPQHGLSATGGSAVPDSITIGPDDDVLPLHIKSKLPKTSRYKADLSQFSQYYRALLSFNTNAVYTTINHCAYGEQLASKSTRGFGFLLPYMLLTGDAIARSNGTVISYHMAVTMMAFYTDFSHKHPCNYILRLLIAKPELIPLFPKVSDLHPLTQLRDNHRSPTPIQLGSFVMMILRTIVKLYSIDPSSVALEQSSYRTLKTAPHPKKPGKTVQKWIDSSSKFRKKWYVPSPATIIPLQTPHERSFITPHPSDTDCSRRYVPVIDVSDPQIAELTEQLRTLLTKDNRKILHEQPMARLALDDFITKIARRCTTSASADEQGDDENATDTLFGAQTAPTELPFELTSHPASQTTVAKTMNERLQKDTVAFADHVLNNTELMLSSLTRTTMSLLLSSGSPSTSGSTQATTTRASTLNDALTQLENLRDLLVGLRDGDYSCITKTRQFLQALVNRVPLPAKVSQESKGHVDSTLFECPQSMNVYFNSISEQEAFSIRERFIFMFGRAGSLESEIDLNYIIGALLSSMSSFDLLKLNPFIPLKHLGLIFALTEVILLHTNRIGHTNRCLNDVYELIGMIERVRASLCATDAAHSISNSSAVTHVNSADVALLTAVLQKSKSLASQLSSKRTYFSEIPNEEVEQINIHIENERYIQRSWKSLLSPQTRASATPQQRERIEQFTSVSFAPHISQWCLVTREMSCQLLTKEVTASRKELAVLTAVEEKRQREQYNLAIGKTAKTPAPVSPSEESTTTVIAPETKIPTAEEIAVGLQHYRPTAEATSHLHFDIIHIHKAHALAAYCSCRERPYFIPTCLAQATKRIVSEHVSVHNAKKLATALGVDEDIVKHQSTSGASNTTADDDSNKMWDILYLPPSYTSIVTHHANKGRYGMYPVTRSGVFTPFQSESRTNSAVYAYDPRFLVFEYTWNLLLRPSQVQQVNEFYHSIIDGKSLVKQMIMGAGKTTVVAPLLTLMLTNGKHMVMEVVPPSLLEFSRSIMRSTFSSVIYKRVYTFHFERATEPTSQMLRKLVTATKQRAVVVSTPTSIKSVMLKFLVLQHSIANPQLGRDDNAESQLRTTCGILKLFQKGILLMDEVDLILHPLKSELNFPFGEKFPLDASPVRWKFAMHVLDAVFYHSSHARKHGGHALELMLQNHGRRGVDILDELADTVDHGFEHQLLQHTPHLVLLNEQFYHQQLKHLVLEWVILFFDNFMASGSTTSTKKSTPSASSEAKSEEIVLLTHAQIKQYLLLTSGQIGITTRLAAQLKEDKNLKNTVKMSPAQQELIDLFDFINDNIPATHIQLLNLAHSWLHSYLPFVLSKINRVSFGLLSPQDLVLALASDPYMPQTRIKLAIPFIGKDVPSSASEFAHPDIIIGLTYMAYRYEGLRYVDFVEVIDSLQQTLLKEVGPHKKRPSNILYEEWVSGAGGVIGAAAPTNATIAPLDPSRSPAITAKMPSSRSPLIAAKQSLSLLEGEDDILLPSADPDADAPSLYDGDVQLLQITAHHQDESISMIPLRLLKRNNLQQMDQLFSLWRTHAPVIQWYLNEFIFPAYMRHQHVKFSASGVDLGGNMLFQRRIGFSGTPSDLLPIDLGRCHYEVGSDGQVLATLTNQNIVSYSSLSAGWSVSSLLSYVAKARVAIPETPMQSHASSLDASLTLSGGDIVGDAQAAPQPEPLFHALIDTGALITGMSNLDVATYLLNNGVGEWADCVVFLDELDRKMVLMKATGRVIKLEQCGIPLQKRFAFYDQVHTTGMDISHRLNATAAITLGKDMVFRDFAQGAYRMRNIGLGQTLHIILTPEIETLMYRQLAPNKVKNDNIIVPRETDDNDSATDDSKPAAPEIELSNDGQNSPFDKLTAQHLQILSPLLRSCGIAIPDMKKMADHQEPHLLLHTLPESIQHRIQLAKIVSWLVLNSMASERTQFCQLSIQNATNIWKKPAFEHLLTNSDYFSSDRFPDTAEAIDQRERYAEQQLKTAREVFVTSLSSVDNEDRKARLIKAYDRAEVIRQKAERRTKAEDWRWSQFDQAATLFEFVLKTQLLNLKNNRKVNASVDEVMEKVRRFLSAGIVPGGQRRNISHFRMSIKEPQVKDFHAQHEYEATVVNSKKKQQVALFTDAVRLAANARGSSTKARKEHEQTAKDFLDPALKKMVAEKQSSQPPEKESSDTSRLGLHEGFAKNSATDSSFDRDIRDVLETRENIDRTATTSIELELFGPSEDQPKSTEHLSRDLFTENCLDIFQEPVDLSVETTIPKQLTFGETLKKRIDAHRHLLNTSDQLAQCQNILQLVMVTANDIETYSLNTEMVQTLENEREREVEQEQEQEIEIEKFVDSVFDRSYEKQVSWPFQSLSMGITSNPQFYHASMFMKYVLTQKKDDNTTKGGDDQQETIQMQFPSPLYLSNNYYNHIHSAPRRLKNIVMALDWIPSLEKATPFVNLTGTTTISFKELVTKHPEQLVTMLYSITGIPDQAHTTVYDHSTLGSIQLTLAQVQKFILMLTLRQDIDLTDPFASIAGTIDGVITGHQLVDLLDSNPQLIYPGWQNRYAVALSLAEAETLRRIFHLKHTKSSPIANTDSTFGLRCISHSNLLISSTNNYPGADKIDSIDGDASTNTAPTTLETAVSAISDQQQQQYLHHMALLLRYINNDTHFVDTDIHSLIGMLDGNLSIKVRVQHFARVIGYRRRLRLKWEDSPIAKVLTAPSRLHYAKTVAFSYALRNYIVERNLAPHHLYKLFDHNKDNLISPVELYSGLTWLGVTSHSQKKEPSLPFYTPPSSQSTSHHHTPLALSPADVVDLISFVIKTGAQPILDYKALCNIFRLSDEDDDDDNDEGEDANRTARADDQPSSSFSDNDIMDYLSTLVIDQVATQEIQTALVARNIAFTETTEQYQHATPTPKETKEDDEADADATDAARPDEESKSSHKPALECDRHTRRAIMRFNHELPSNVELIGTGRFSREIAAADSSNTPDEKPPSTTEGNETAQSPSSSDDDDGELDYFILDPFSGLKVNPPLPPPHLDSTMNHQSFRKTLRNSGDFSIEFRFVGFNRLEKTDEYYDPHKIYAKMKNNGMRLSQQVQDSKLGLMKLIYCYENNLHSTEWVSTDVTSQAITQDIIDKYTAHDHDISQYPTYLRRAIAFYNEAQKDYAAYVTQAEKRYFKAGKDVTPDLLDEIHIDVSHPNHQMIFQPFLPSDLSILGEFGGNSYYVSTKAQYDELGNQSDLDAMNIFGNSSNPSEPGPWCLLTYMALEEEQAISINGMTVAQIRNNSARPGPALAPLMFFGCSNFDTCTLEVHVRKIVYHGQGISSATDPELQSLFASASFWTCTSCNRENDLTEQVCVFCDTPRGGDNDDDAQEPDGNDADNNDENNTDGDKNDENNTDENTTNPDAVNDANADKHDTNSPQDHTEPDQVDNNQDNNDGNHTSSTSD